MILADIDSLYTGKVVPASVILPFAFAEPTPEKSSPEAKAPVWETVGEPTNAPLTLPVPVIDDAIVPEILLTVNVLLDVLIDSNFEVTVWVAFANDIVSPIETFAWAVSLDKVTSWIISEIKIDVVFWYNAIAVAFTEVPSPFKFVCVNVTCSPVLVLNTPELAEPVFAVYVNTWAALVLADTPWLSKNGNNVAFGFTPFARNWIRCSLIKGIIEILTERIPTERLIVSGGLTETIPVLVLFSSVVFAKREIVFDVDVVFLVFIKLSSLVETPLQEKLQSSHCFPKPFSFPCTQLSFNPSRFIRTIGLPTSANHTSLGGVNVSCPLNCVVPNGLIVSVLLDNGWTTKFEDEYARVTRSPVLVVLALEPVESWVNLKESE